MAWLPWRKLKKQEKGRLGGIIWKSKRKRPSKVVDSKLIVDIANVVGIDLGSDQEKVADNLNACVSFDKSRESNKINTPVGGVADVKKENSDVGNEGCEGKVIEEIKNEGVKGIVRKGGKKSRA
jgi:hypothetical protein